MIAKFPFLIIFYIVILSLLIIYFNKMIKMIFNDIEQKKNITDLLFLKLLLDFIYSNDLMNQLEKIISGIRITENGNVLEIFKKIIPEAENKIETVYEPLNKYNEIKNYYDLLHENFSWLLYFMFIYGGIEIAIYLLYRIEIIEGYRISFFFSILLYSVYIIATITSAVIVISIYWLILMARRRIELWDSDGADKYAK